MDGEVEAMDTIEGKGVEKKDEERNNKRGDMVKMDIIHR
jgi:hypothetical protein